MWIGAEALGAATVDCDEEGEDVELVPVKAVIVYGFFNIVAGELKDLQPGIY